MSRLNRFLFIVVIILAAATALVWFKPDIIETITSYSWNDLNPFKGKDIASELVEKSPETPVSLASQPVPDGESVKPPAENAAASPSLMDKEGVIIEKDNELREEEPEIIAKEEPKETIETLTLFEKDIKQRQDSFQTKVFTYEPYQAPVSRNPFQRIVSTVYFSEAEEKIAQELSTEEEFRRFVQPELPPETQYSGFISSGDHKLAIIELDEETYIVKEGDTLLDHYVVSLIETDRVVIDINGYSIPIKLGGEETNND